MLLCTASEILWRRSCLDLSSPPSQTQSFLFYFSVHGLEETWSECWTYWKDWLNSFPTSTPLTVCMGADFQDPNFLHYKAIVYFVDSNWNQCSWQVLGTSKKKAPPECWEFFPTWGWLPPQAAGFTLCGHKLLVRKRSLYSF